MLRVIKSQGLLERYGLINPDDSILKGTAKIADNIVSVDYECIEYPYDFCRMFARDKAVQVTLDIGKAEKYLGQYCFNPFWARPMFGDDLSSETKEMQYLLVKTGNKYVFVLPVSNDNYNTTILSDGDYVKLCVNMLYSGAEKICGDIAVIYENTDPYDAVKQGFEFAYEKGLIKTPVRDGKKYPDVLNKLGWCSWNAFYHNVTEDKLIAKLEEFKRKNIPVKWILIDDGWSEVKDMKLLSIYEDKTKFPDGLKHTINIIKTEYGIESVGVWHSLTGYWYGTEFEDDTVVEVRKDRIIPKGYDFYSKWHSYLREQGVDFIKVDCQGNTVEFSKNSEGALGTISEIFDGIEKSAEENFDFMINCMGMNTINSHNHKKSVLIRSSDDFYPEKSDGFYNHSIDNIYNSVFFNELFYCDFDMFWSKHFDVKQNAVLRFFSGGPVYMSDELENSDAEYLKKFCDSDGRFDRYDIALRPAYDSLFGFNKGLKAFTKTGEDYIVVVFTYSESAELEVSAKDFGGDGKYKVEELFSKKSVLLEQNDCLNVKMKENDVVVYKFMLV